MKGCLFVRKCHPDATALFNRLKREGRVKDWLDVVYAGLRAKSKEKKPKEEPWK